MINYNRPNFVYNIYEQKKNLDELCVTREKGEFYEKELSLSVYFLVHWHAFDWNFYIREKSCLTTVEYNYMLVEIIDSIR